MSSPIPTCHLQELKYLDALLPRHEGAVRLVRTARRDGYVLHYKGARGAERVVRVVRPDGTTVDPTTESA